MNYQRIYDQLISRARTRLIDIAGEKHHIIPRSMGGNNNKKNIVKLTFHEHFVAHLLLWRIYHNNSMAYAVWMMAHTRGIRITGRTYALLKSEISGKVRKQMTGKIVTETTRNKMSESGLGRVFTEEHRNNISKGSKGKVSKMKGKSYNLSNESKALKSNSRKGKCVGDDNPMRREDVKLKQRQSCANSEAVKAAHDASKGHRPYHFRRISVNGIEYESITSATKILNVTYNWLYRRIRAKEFTEYKYI